MGSEPEIGDCPCFRRHVIVIMPPLVITLDELDRIAGAVERGIVAATEG